MVVCWIATSFAPNISIDPHTINPTSIMSDLMVTILPKSPLANERIHQHMDVNTKYHNPESTHAFWNGWLLSANMSKIIKTILPPTIHIPNTPAIIHMHICRLVYFFFWIWPDFFNLVCMVELFISVFVVCCGIFIFWFVLVSVSQSLIFYYCGEQANKILNHFLLIVWFLYHPISQLAKKWIESNAPI